MHRTLSLKAATLPTFIIALSAHDLQYDAVIKHYLCLFTIVIAILWHSRIITAQCILTNLDAPLYCKPVYAGLFRSYARLVYRNNASSLLQSGSLVYQTASFRQERGRQLFYLPPSSFVLLEVGARE